ncbi:MAG: DUF996 domain-containing protein [Candidatus Bathyarchaeota archaeon]|nr:DUF996 domain-containing protein [Candidatus Termiticorpusculum sp.]
MNFESSIKLGYFGAFILIIVCGIAAQIISYIVKGLNDYGITKIVGIILILISLYNLAKVYNSKKIYSNAKIGAIVAIVGIITNTIYGIYTIHIYQNVISPIDIALIMQLFFQILTTVFISAIIQFTFFTIASIFVIRSLNELAAHSNIHEFKTAGQIIQIGAILTIIFIGIPIMGIGFIVLGFAFLKLKEPQPTPPPNTQPIPTTIDSLTNFCTKCGTPIQPNATFCVKCGKQI